MKKKLWKQWRFWLEVALGLLSLFFMLGAFGFAAEISDMNNALGEHNYYYDSKEKEIFEYEDDESNSDDTTDSTSSEEESSKSEPSETSTSSSSETEKSSEEPFDPNSYQTVDYNEWNHDKVGLLSKVQITGKVVQFIKGSSGDVNLRVAVNDNYDNMVLVSIDSDEYKEVIAEDDNVTIYGKNGGLTSYESTLRSEITLPSLFNDKYIVNSYGN
ncbi:hypothetical protein [Streptococcus jiangjianxini]|uniref:hypothetical protein n=1 Tax=Streptococcus jiangjianxini TaxID=3161189 RepID=UPI0032EB0811